MISGTDVSGRRRINAKCVIVATIAIIVMIVTIVLVTTMRRRGAAVSKIQLTARRWPDIGRDVQQIVIRGAYFFRITTKESSDVMRC